MACAPPDTPAIFGIRTGYSTDDNARALVLIPYLDELRELPAETIEDLTTRYLANVACVFDPARQSQLDRIQIELDVLPSRSRTSPQVMECL